MLLFLPMLLLWRKLLGGQEGGYRVAGKARGVGSRATGYSFFQMLRR